MKICLPGSIKKKETAKDAFLSECGNSVYYDSSKHLSVLFQLYGSVWPEVLPYCLLNTGITFTVLYLRHFKHIDLTFSEIGHSFMNMMVSFLIVSRTSITLSRFMEAREHLSTMFRSARGLIRAMAVLTQYEKSREAVKWRDQMALITMYMLRVTSSTLQYRSSKKPSWEVPELPFEFQEELRKKTTMIEDSDSSGDGACKWAHGKVSLMEENFRVPSFVAYTLNSTIVSNRVNLASPLPPPTEVKLLNYVDEYLAAFEGLRKLITTPFPFPLVQMARTFLLVWVFTLPFVLTRKIESPFALMIIIFMITYGFVGLESVSVELDDPFGDDPNDFDDLKMVHMVFEDIYVIMNEINGEASVNMLRRAATERTLNGSKHLGSIFLRESSPLLQSVLE